MPLSPGAKLGPYEIIALVGAGGMGEVYKAHDPRLKRDVAIKASAAQFSERFEREAHAIAALNHPYICTLYDIGPDYLVMEFVEGETLAARLKRGALKLESALPLAIQITDALAEAHSKGIVHRDLKPANIMLTKSGLKVLDFGLAKMERQATGEEQNETITAKGAILGTVQYMSPEQAQGKEADARSDIFSFGLVLYEMIAGKRAFEGANPTSIIAAILERDSPSLEPEVLNRVVRACLAKDPDDRFQSVRDLKRDLEWQVADVRPSAAVKSPKWKMLPWAIVGLLATALAVAELRHPFEVAAPRRIQLTLLPPENGSFYFNGPAAVSPDGRIVAFGAAVDGVSAIWVRHLDRATARPLPETEGATTLAWSPDGRSIAFVSPDRRLKRIDLAGGPARAVCDLPNGFGGLSWGARDVIVFGDPKGTWRVPASGGNPTLVAALNPETEVWHQNPWFLPDGRHFLISISGRKAEDNGVYAGDIDSRDLTRNRRPILASRHAGITYAEGHLLYLRDRTLMAQPFDAGRLETTGEAVPVAEQVDNDQGWTRWGVSTNGVLAYTSGAIGPEQLTWHDRSGKALSVFGPAGVITTVAISPDGSTVAFDRMDETVGEDIWLHDLTRGSDSRFTSGYYARPVWSPGGNNIAFSSRGFSQASSYQKSRSGGPEQRVAGGWVWDWSRDGRYMIAEIRNANKSDLWVIPLFGDRKAFPYLHTEFEEHKAKFSPDVHWVAYASNETGRFEVYVQGFPNPSGKLQVSNTGGDFPVWSRDGRELFFISGDQKMMVAEVKTTGGRFEASTPKALFATRVAELADVNLGIPYDVTRDGHFLVVTPQRPPGGPMTVVINWNVGLKK